MLGALTLSFGSITATFQNDVATQQYDQALMWCHEQFSAKLGITDVLQQFDHVLFHHNAPYHAKRNLRLMCDNMYGKLTREQHEQLYKKYVVQGVQISAQNATTYTCPLYASLISLVAKVSEGSEEYNHHIPTHIGTATYHCLPLPTW